MRTPILLLAVFAAAPLFAGEGQPVSAAPAAPAPAVPTPAVAAPAMAAPVPSAAPALPEIRPAAPTIVITPDAPQPTIAKGKDTLSVDFPDEDIRTILRNVADLFELNIVVPDTLQGKATIKLRDVSWRQIFQVVLSPVGYTFVEDGNIIKIINQDALSQEPVTTDIFVLNYAKASDMVAAINPLVDAGKGGKIIIDVRSNSLVITEHPTQMKRISGIIDQLDKATDQVMIETKFIEVNENDTKNIGVNWSSLSGYGASAGPFNRSYNDSQGQSRSNGINNSGSTNNANGTTNSNTNSNGSTSSTNFSVSGGAPTSTLTNGTSASTAVTNGITASTDVSTALSNLNALTNTSSLARNFTAVFSANQFNVVLSALQSLNTSKIVSNPTVVTLNNSEAVINVGEEDPLPQYTYNPQTGAYVVSGFDYKPIGVILKVTPQVNARGFIKLTLAPEVSQKTGAVSFGGTDIPIIGTRKATTTVSLKDGYTMGIGGLLTSQSTKGKTSVPILGSLPLLGQLFRSDSNDLTKTNLIIFITAKTINSEGAPAEEIFDSRNIREMGVKRDELPGFRDGSDPFVPLPTPPEPKKSSNPRAK